MLISQGGRTRRTSLFKRYDHVAIAVEDIDEAYRTFVDGLGAKVVDGKHVAGEGAYSVSHLVLGDLRIELIQPEGKDSFVAKFLKGRGSMVHHMTFQVDDLEETLRTLERRGFRIIGKDTRNPRWKTAFVHPSTAKGVLIQMYESDET